MCIEVLSCRLELYSLNNFGHFFPRQRQLPQQKVNARAKITQSRHYLGDTNTYIRNTLLIWFELCMLMFLFWVHVAIFHLIRDEKIYDRFFLKNKRTFILEHAYTTSDTRENFHHLQKHECIENMYFAWNVDTHTWGLLCCFRIMIKFSFSLSHKFIFSFGLFVVANILV